MNGKAILHREATLLWAGGTSKALAAIAPGWGLLSGTRMIYPVLLSQLSTEFDLTVHATLRSRSREARRRRLIIASEVQWRVQEIATSEAPASIGPYSQAIRDGDRVYVSGQGPVDPETDGIVSDDVEE